MKVTLDPRGRHVVLDKSFGSPTITKEALVTEKPEEKKSAGMPGGMGGGGMDF